MDQDSSDRYIQQGDYRMLKNGIIDQSADGGRFAVKNLKSSKLHCTFANADVCIGAKIYKDYIYAFYYDDTNVLTRLFKISTTTEDSYMLLLYKDFGHDENTRITDINIVENAIDGELYCYFIDGINQPFKVNLTTLEGDNTYYTNIEDMYVIREVPPEPTISPRYNWEKSSVDMADKAFQFATRYVYEDGEKSPLSTYSKTAYQPLNTVLDYITNASIGYYIYSGVLYRIDNWGTPYVVNSNIETYYDEVRTNENGEIVILFTTNYTSYPNANILISYDSGMSFIPAYDESAEDVITSSARDACMSSDGKYIYIGTYESDYDVYVSSNYGSSFTVLRSSSSAYWTDVKCSSDGRYVYYTNGNPAATNNVVYRSSDYGQTDEVLYSYSNYAAEMCVAVSPSGKYVVYQAYENSGDRLMYYSTNYGASFSTTAITNAYKNLGVTDSGICIAHEYDNGVASYVYYTDDFFASRSLLHTVTHTDTSSGINIWYSQSLKDGVITTIRQYNTGTDYFNVYFDDDNGDNIQTITDNDSIVSFNRIPTLRSRDIIRNNYYNEVSISIDEASKYVDIIEVYAVDVNTGTTYLIKELKNEDISTLVEVIFDNSSLYRILSDTEKNILFSNVPTMANNQSIVNNRLFYANYTDGVNLPDADFSAIASYSTYNSTSYDVSYPFTYAAQLNTNGVAVTKGQELIFAFEYKNNTSSPTYHKICYIHKFLQDYADISSASCRSEIETTWASAFEHANDTDSSFGDLLLRLSTGYTYTFTYTALINDNSLTLKKGYSVKYGISYYDNYNRGGFPIFDDSNISIPYDISEATVDITVTINHTPPSWATKFKIVRTDRLLNYQIIKGFKYSAYYDGNIWLMKYEDDTYTPSVGTLLDFTKPDGSIFSSQVIKKETKDADFVEGSPAGDWIAISQVDEYGYSSSDIIRGNDNYSDTVIYARSVRNIEDGIIYYEIPTVYDISGGYHVGNSQTQTASVPAIVTIEDDGNVFYSNLDNIEIYNISNTNNFYNGGRSLIETEKAGQVNRYASITWSDLFVQDTGYNGLSMFNLGLINYKDLDVKDGAIKAIRALESNLFIWQEDKVGHILIGKDNVTYADSDSNIVGSDKIAGGYVPYAGIYGTKYNESVLAFGRSLYFVDVDRNVVCRIGGDGITEISNYYMNSYFNEVFSSNTNYYACYNSKNKEYWLLDKETEDILVFDEKGNRWTRIIESQNTIHKLINGEAKVYAFVADDLYIYGEGTAYGEINGASNELELEYVDSEMSSEPKAFNAIETESNKALDVECAITDNSVDIPKEDFEKREREYFAYIPNSGESVNSDEDLETGMIIPLGDVSSNDDNGVITLKNTSPIFSTINHYLYYSLNGAPLLIGNITSVDGYDITTDADMSTDFYADKFVFAKEKSYINARNLTDNTINITLKDDTNTYTEIYGVNINTTKINN